jgi:signal transduction histidine kinase
VERIFEPHYTTKVKGLGLGLAIARQIVEEHGGTIRAESNPGKGTSVRIHLPAAAPGGTGGSPPVGPRAAKGARPTG